MTSTLPSPSAGQEREPAPSNNLPEWDECALRVANSEFFAKNVAEGGHGPDADAKLATELHRFIHEYDDADGYRSAWFLHRLELLLDETRRAALTSASKQEGGEPSDAAIMALWAACDTPSAENDYTTGPLPFARALLALSAPQPPLAGAGEALKWCAAALQAVIDSRGERGSITMFLSGEKKTLDEVLDMADQALNPKPAPLNGGCGDGESEISREDDGRSTSASQRHTCEETSECAACDRTARPLTALQFVEWIEAQDPDREPLTLRETLAAAQRGAA